MLVASLVKSALASDPAAGAWSVFEVFESVFKPPEDPAGTVVLEARASGLCNGSAMIVPYELPKPKKPSTAPMLGNILIKF